MLLRYGKQVKREEQGERRHRGRGETYECTEHEVVVVGHGGVVEEGGFVSPARIVDDEIFHFAVFLRASWNGVRPYIKGCKYQGPNRRSIRLAV